MFSGIIESKAVILSIEKSNTNLQLWFKADFIEEIKVDQSIAHNGICLTVDKLEINSYRVTAIDETISKTTISNWKIGDTINVERCLKIGDRLDGHIVQGHIDTIAECVKKEDKNGSWEFQFTYPKQYKNLLIEKGSIAVDGISLTCHSLVSNSFSVSLIPFTLVHTNAANWGEGKTVNIEFDLIGKYLQRNLSTS